MRALVQRVTSAAVSSEGEPVGEIGPGLCVFVGVTHDDTAVQAIKLADKVANLRVFEDDDGNMNRSAAELGLSFLAVSQFTLYGDATKGRRPSFVQAARPEQAEPLLEAFVAALREAGHHVETGRFRTNMAVSLVNDGPVTLMIEV